MKKRLMLPAMAFVFAIGLSFATERSTADPTTDWILVDEQNQVYQPLGMEINCGDGTDACSIQFGEDVSTEQALYDAPGVRKEGSGDIIKL